MIKKCIYACVALFLMCSCSEKAEPKKEENKGNKTETTVSEKKSPFGKVSSMAEDCDVLPASVYPKGSPVDKWGKLKITRRSDGMRYLSDEKGNPVQLKGMSSHGLQWAGVANITETNIKSLRNEWNCNIFRVALYVDFEGGYAHNPNMRAHLLENLVKWTAQNGMYLLIDWHVLSPGNPQSMSYRKSSKGGVDLAADFFTYCSRRFQYQKHIIYELCNEPNSTKGEVNWQRHIKTYCESMLEIIRSNDRDVVCICGTPDWCQRPQDVIGHEPQDKDGNVYENLMYSFHFYSASHNDGAPDTSGVRGYDFMTMFRTDDTTHNIPCILKELPIFVTEFGTTDASGWNNFRPDITDKWLEILGGKNDAKQLVSWCNWSFSAEGGECAALKWNTGKISPMDPAILTPSGKYIFKKLHEK